MPSRNEKGEIRGLQIRKMKLESDKENRYFWCSSNDAKSSSPIHFSNAGIAQKTKEIYLTEGALKADTIADIAGVGNSHETVIQELNANFPNLKKVNLCFDNDRFTNERVAETLKKITDLLIEASYSVENKEWDSAYKGYDDYLNAKVRGNV